MTRKLNSSKSAASCRGSKRMKGRVARAVRVMNLSADCCIDQQAMITLMALANPHEHAELFYAVCSALQPFATAVQYSMVEALLLYYTGEACSVTGIASVDNALNGLYAKIREILP